MAVKHATSDGARKAQARGQANRQPPAGYHWCALCARKYAKDGEKSCKGCAKTERHLCSFGCGYPVAIPGPCAECICEEDGL